MIALEGRLEWRLTAPFHVQLQLQLEMPLSIPIVSGDVQVQGRVVRVFRTDGRLALGDRVGSVIFACNPGDEPTGPHTFISMTSRKRGRWKSTSTAILPSASW